MTYEKQNLEDIVDEWNDWTKYEKKFNDKNGPGPADSELRLKVGRKWWPERGMSRRRKNHNLPL